MWRSLGVVVVTFVLVAGTADAGKPLSASRLVYRHVEIGEVLFHGAAPMTRLAKGRRTVTMRLDGRFETGAKLVAHVARDQAPVEIAIPENRVVHLPVGHYTLSAPVQRSLKTDYRFSVAPVAYDWRAAEKAK